MPTGSRAWYTRCQEYEDQYGHTHIEKYVLENADNVMFAAKNTSDTCVVQFALPIFWIGTARRNNQFYQFGNKTMFVFIE